MNKRPGVFVDESFNDDMLELPHEDFSAYCRLCFSISQLEPLFASRQEQENYQLVGMVEMCTGIKLSAKTDSPASICLQCRLTMDEFFNFRKLCQRLDRVYRRKRIESAAVKFTTALEYNQNGLNPEMPAVPPVAVDPMVMLPVDPPAPSSPAVQLETIPDDATPMEETDETCATIVAHEPSALEASVVAEGAAPESFIVHELSDEDEAAVECAGVTAMETMTAFDLGEDNDDPFIKMANDWFCCRMCSRLYQSFILLVEHLRDVHPEKAQLLCDRSKEYLFKAKDSDLQVLQYGSSLLIKCDLCDTLLSGKHCIMRHRWRYHGGFDDCRKVTCKMASCECFFMETKALNRHLQVVHGRKRKTTKKKAVSTGTDGSAAVEEDNAEDDDVVIVSDDPAQQDYNSADVVQIDQ